MTTVLIGGGTGLVGKRLSQLLHEKGYKVRHLSRNGNLNAEFPAFKWNLKEQTIEEAALENVDFIINLAGAGIADKRWTNARKKIIIDSRVETTQIFQKYIKNGKLKPKAFISASAVGFYGHQEEKLMEEAALAGSGFLSESVAAWENAIHELEEETQIRTVLLRIGIVLSSQGGAMPELMKTFPFGVGAYFGKGKSYYSWIHIDDVAKSFIFALEEKSMSGIYNSVAPNPSTVKNLVYKMKKAYRRFVLVLPVPEIGIKLAFGELSHTVLDSTKVSSKKLKSIGFKFEFPELLPALQDILKRKI